MTVTASEAWVKACCELAEARYHDWFNRESGPEWERRLADLRARNVPQGGRALLELRVTGELLTLDVLQRIAIYRATATEKQCWTMLAKPHLDQLRQRIMVTIGASLARLKGGAKRKDAASGGRSIPPHEKRYGDIQAKVLTVVNTGLKSLEAESLAFAQGSVDRTVPQGGTKVRVEPVQKKRIPLVEPAGPLVVKAWSEVAISFLSDDRVEIRVGTITQTRNFAEMGFENKKTGAPILAWKTLRDLAESGGTSAASFEKRKDLEKRIQELRGKLRALISVPELPFQPPKRERHPGGSRVVYRANFKISCRSSYPT